MLNVKNPLDKLTYDSLIKVYIYSSFSCCLHLFRHWPYKFTLIQLYLITMASKSFICNIFYATYCANCSPAHSVHICQRDFVFWHVCMCMYLPPILPSVHATLQLNRDMYVPFVWRSIIKCQLLDSRTLQYVTMYGQKFDLMDAFGCFDFALFQPCLIDGKSWFNVYSFILKYLWILRASL